MLMTSREEDRPLRRGQYAWVRRIDHCLLISDKIPLFIEKLYFRPIFTVDVYSIILPEI